MDSNGSSAISRARLAVLAFGLFHGFGLATKLQDFSLPQRGLVTNIVSFNIGVEIGQVLALTAVLLALTYGARVPALRAMPLPRTRADDRWVPADRPAAGRLLPVSVMPSGPGLRRRRASRSSSPRCC
jgi:hypothetical protein